MDFWNLSESGKKRFRYGKRDDDRAADAATQCSAFKNDDEDEAVSDIGRSCYNCRYRRWTVDSFDCLKCS